MKSRERAIMDYTRCMGELGAEHTEALTAATLSYLEYLQAGNDRSDLERSEAELSWRSAVYTAYRDWKYSQAKARAELESVLDADPGKAS